jgi:hypothetical protein
MLRAFVLDTFGAALRSIWLLTGKLSRACAQKGRWFSHAKG